MTFSSYQEALVSTTIVLPLKTISYNKATLKYEDCFDNILRVIKENPVHKLLNTGINDTLKGLSINNISREEGGGGVSQKLTFTNRWEGWYQGKANNQLLTSWG